MSEVGLVVPVTLGGADVPPLLHHRNLAENARDLLAKPYRPPEKVTFPPRPPHLDNRMREYGIEMPDFAPVFDRVFVYPVKERDTPEQGKEGLIIPDVVRKQLGAQRGVLIAAGPKAIEQLYAHGIVLGDILITARLSPWERRYWAGAVKGEDGVYRGGSEHRVLILRAADVVGSEDLRGKYESGELRLEMDETGHVQLHDRERVDPDDNEEGM